MKTNVVKLLPMVAVLMSSAAWAQDLSAMPEIDVAPSSETYAQSEIEEEETSVTDETALSAVMGDIVIKPSIAVSEEYDDNIYTEDTGEQDDFITRIAPQVVVDTAAKPHLLRFTAGAMQALYADHSDDNYLNYNTSVKGRYKIDETASWNGFADYRRLHSDRGDDLANPNADASEPLPYDVIRANTSVKKDFGKLNLQPRIGLTNYDFENVRRVNGALIDQGYRDRDEYVAGGRIGYDVRENMQVFTDLEYNPRDYDISGAISRDSEGGSYLAGVQYKPERDMTFEAAAGYMDREYDENTYDDIDTIDITAKWDWTYWEQSRVRASFDRYVAEVTDTGVGGAVRSDARVSVTRLLTPDLSGKVEGRYLNSDYEGGNGATNGVSDREDDFYKASFELSYALTEKASLTADYSFGHNDSNRDTADYEQNVFMLGVGLKF